MNEQFFYLLTTLVGKKCYFSMFWAVHFCPCYACVLFQTICLHLHLCGLCVSFISVYGKRKKVVAPALIVRVVCAS